MKKILITGVILLVVLLSCSNKGTYISVEQIESKYSITVGGDTNKNKIYQIRIPLVYKIKKNVFEDILFDVESDYMYHGQYDRNRGRSRGIAPDQPKDQKPIEDYKTLKRSFKEYVFWVNCAPDTSAQARSLMQPYLYRIRKEGKNPIQIGTIQQVKETDPEFIKAFLGNDSIDIAFVTDKKRRIRHIILPVEIK